MTMAQPYSLARSESLMECYAAPLFDTKALDSQDLKALLQAAVDCKNLPAIKSSVQLLESFSNKPKKTISPEEQNSTDGKAAMPDYIEESMAMRIMRLCDEQVDLYGSKAMISLLKSKFMKQLDTKIINLYLSTALNSIKEEAENCTELSTAGLLKQSNACILSILQLFEENGALMDYSSMEMIVSHYITMHGVSLSKEILMSLSDRIHFGHDLLNYLLYQISIEKGDCQMALETLQEAILKEMAVTKESFDIILSGCLQESSLNTLKKLLKFKEELHAAADKEKLRKLADGNGGEPSFLERLTSNSEWLQMDEFTTKSAISIFISHSDYLGLIDFSKKFKVKLQSDDYYQLFLSLFRSVKEESEMPSILHLDEQKQNAYLKAEQLLVRLKRDDGTLDAPVKEALLRLFTIELPPIKFLDFIDTLSFSK